MKQLHPMTALLLLILFTACRKENPQESPGNNTQFIYSDWMSVNWNLQNAGSSKKMGINDPRITEAFLQDAVVLFYVRTKPNYITDNVSTIRSIPYTNASDVFYYEVGPIAPQVRFRAYSEAGSNVSVAWIQDVRYVLIHGGAVAQSNQLQYTTDQPPSINLAP